MNRFLKLVNDHKDILASAITAEHGKIPSDARARSTAESTS